MIQTNFGYYIFVILAAIIGFLIVKKVTSCMFKTLVAFIAALVIAIIYFVYIK